MHFKRVDENALRKLAENLIATGAVTRRPVESGDQALHELLVHQTELEMQNEALRDAQAELMESEQRHRDLLANAPIGYLVLDSSSRVLSANPWARDLLGAGVVGTRVTQYLLPDEAIAFERYRRQVLNAPDRFAGDFTMIDAGGRRREVRLDSIRTNATGTEWQAALSDVTVLNAAIRKLNHTERLGAVGEHASGIAHDLNNLLYSITGHASIAMRFLNEEHPAYEPLVQLRSVVDRCAAATQQLASFTRADTSAPSVVDLNETIGEMEVLLRSLLGDEIDLELDASAPDASVRMDASQIEQILLTVVRNARHAMPHGGRFRVETTTSTIREPAREGSSEVARYVRWTMSDTGVGMTEDTRRRAFEPFFTTKPAGSGTGLGLSLVKKIVERAGGEALLESEIGRGTSLVIHLPCASASMSSRPAPPVSEPPSGTG